MTAGAYGQAPKPKGRRWNASDPRYGSYRWRIRTRLPVLRRDGWRCWVQGCEAKGDVADHIRPVYPGMPDSEFFDQSRLRASCRAHNIARAYTGTEHEAAFGMVDRRRRPAARTSVITRDYTRKPKVW
jgi:hypothetical protein